MHLSLRPPVLINMSRIGLWHLGHSGVDWILVIAVHAGSGASITELTVTDDGEGRTVIREITYLKAQGSLSGARLWISTEVGV